MTEDRGQMTGNQKSVISGILRMKLPRKEHAKAVNTNGSFRRAVRNHLEQKFDNLVGVHGFSVY
ncbi:MAG: hypothetical protein WCP55_22695 [Lentisphaerota bacterium]